MREIFFGAIIAMLLGLKPFPVGVLGSPAVPAGCPTSCSLYFTGASGSFPSNFTQAKGTWQITTTPLNIADTTGDSPGDAWWSANTFTNDQHWQIVAGTAGTNYTGPMVRHQAVADSYYGLFAITGSETVWLVTAGTLTTSVCSFGVLYTPGATLKLSVSGATLTASLNGTTECTGTDSTLAGGYPGVVNYGSGVAAISSPVTGGNGP